jgi:hypothetical protein
MDTASACFFLNNEQQIPMLASVVQGMVDQRMSGSELLDPRDILP